MSKQPTKPAPTIEITLDPELQLDLFGIQESPTATERYSNTIELYDSLPKYLWDSIRDIESLKDAPTIDRLCTFRNVEYRVTVKPAIIEKQGRNVLIYPSAREEFVEDALRKIAVSGNMVKVSKMVGVNFTLYKLQQELENNGHSYNLTQIKEAIMVCSKSSLDVSRVSEDPNNGDTIEGVISSPFFPVVALTTRKDLQRKDKDSKCYVEFHPLVTKSIEELTYRSYNYTLGMSISSPLARFIYKRMSHYFTQANVNTPYTPSLVSFLQSTPRGVDENMGQNVRAMKRALDALVKHEVVDHYEAESIKQGNKVLDVRYKIYPHSKFVKMVIASNAERKERIAKVEVAKIRSKMSGSNTVTELE